MTPHDSTRFEWKKDENGVPIYESYANREPIPPSRARDVAQFGFAWQKEYPPTPALPSGEGPDFAAAERAAKCVEDWVPDDEYENTRNLARAYLALKEQVATLTAIGQDLARECNDRHAVLAYLALTQRPVDILSDEWWAKEVQAT